MLIDKALRIADATEPRRQLDKEMSSRRMRVVRDIAPP